MAGNPGGTQGVKDLRVSVDTGDPFADYAFDTSADCGGSCSEGDMGWTPQTYSFTANDTDAVLTFADRTTPNDTNGGAALDNVMLFELQPQVAKVIEIKKPVFTHWDFTIFYDNPGGPELVLIKDTAPAEFDVVAIETEPGDLPLECGDETSFFDGFGMVDVWRGGKLGKKCQSATHIEWMPDSDDLAANSGKLFVATAGPDGAGDIYELDPSDGSVLAGPTALEDASTDPYAITGLAFHPTTGVLYGTTSANSTTDPANLVTIDPDTGVVTPIGAHTVGKVVADITFAPDGTLYGWLENVLDDLVTIDLITGVATIVGESGIGGIIPAPSSDTRGSGLAMAPDGTLYSCGQCDTDWNGNLIEITPATGAYASHTSLTGADTRRVGGLAYSGDGTLFGTRKAQNGGNEQLVTIDTATSTLSSIADLSVPNVDAIVFGTTMGAMLRVDLETRQSPSGKSKWKPTSCGPLYLNDGATAYEKDEFGDIIGLIAGPTPPLCVAALEDIDGGGLVGDGTGDEDGDNLEDYAEACTNEIRTDPCDPDTDGDGVDDDVDLCPLEGLEVTGSVDLDGCPIVL
jgi:hypothetical protein